MLKRLPAVMCFAVYVMGLNSMTYAQNLAKADIASALTSYARNNQFPSRLSFNLDGREIAGDINYTFKPQYHAAMAEVYLQYQPDYACFVAIDVETGAILNLTSFIKADEQWDNLVMRAEYPAASVFKMVTAAAGLDTGKLTPKTITPFNGKSTSLYKKQVFGYKKNRYTRKPTFKESFAKSINPVFARIGIYDLGAQQLNEYAQRFGYDEPLQTDFELPQSQIKLDFDQEWEIAEAASGYTREVTLSPIHAAQMAAIVANDGKMVVPFMVDSITALDGSTLYQAQVNPNPSQVISAQAAAQLRSMMQETTKSGSARKSFQGLGRYSVYKGLEIGGKTGSLTGASPQGRHDWFVGYAMKNGKKIAYASLIVNKEKWYVRSAYVARQFIYNYFTELDKQQIVSK